MILQQCPAHGIGHTEGLLHREQPFRAKGSLRLLESGRLQAVVGAAKSSSVTLKKCPRRSDHLADIVNTFTPSMTPLCSCI